MNQFGGSILRNNGPSQASRRYNWEKMKKLLSQKFFPEHIGRSLY